VTVHQSGDKEGRFNHGRRKRKGRVGRWFAELYFLRSFFGYCLIGTALFAARRAYEEDTPAGSGSVWFWISALVLGSAGFEIVVNVLIDKKIAAAKQDILDELEVKIDRASRE
jgi:hypothetical protein